MIKFAVSETNDVEFDGSDWKLVFKDGRLNRYLNEFEVAFIQGALEYARQSK